jgi:hypothetical protein
MQNQNKTKKLSARPSTAKNDQKKPKGKNRTSLFRQNNQRQFNAKLQRIPRTLKNEVPGDKYHPATTSHGDVGHTKTEHHHGFSMHTFSKARRKHHRLNNELFAQEMELSIDRLQATQEEYTNVLLYPELCKGRIPFICPVPTAVCRGVSYYTFNPDNSVGDTFMWSFIPEIVSGQTFDGSAA